MAKLTILVHASPDVEEHARFAFELAKAAAAGGHHAVLFGLGDGAYLADARLSQGRRAGIVKEVREYLEKQAAVAEGGADGSGAGRLEVLTCSLSAEERGLEGDGLIPGARVSSTVNLGRLLGESDKSIFLVP